jgi:hypothetical protein
VPLRIDPRELVLDAVSRRKTQTLSALSVSLTDDHVHERVQASQIVGVARDDHRAESPRQERHTGVDHVGSPAPAAQNTDRLGFVAIQHLHVEQSGPEQSRETRLPRPITPHLRHDTGRDVKGTAVRHGQLDQRANLAVVAFEGDESPRVQNYRPSTARAHASSFAEAEARAAEAKGRGR